MAKGAEQRASCAGPRQGTETPSPLAGRWPEGPDEGDRAERDGSDRATRSAARRSRPWYISKVSGTPRSHLAPLDPPHPSLLRNDTFPREGEGRSAPSLCIQDLSGHFVRRGLAFEFVARISLRQINSKSFAPCFCTVSPTIDSRQDIREPRLPLAKSGWKRRRDRLGFGARRSIGVRRMRGGGVAARERRRGTRSPGAPASASIVSLDRSRNRRISRPLFQIVYRLTGAAGGWSDDIRRSHRQPCGHRARGGNLRRGQRRSWRADRSGSDRRPGRGHRRGRGDRPARRGPARPAICGKRPLDRGDWLLSVSFGRVRRLLTAVWSARRGLRFWLDISGSDPPTPTDSTCFSWTRTRKTAKPRRSTSWTS